MSRSTVIHTSFSHTNPFQRQRWKGILYRESTAKAKKMILFRDLFNSNKYFNDL